MTIDTDKIFPLIVPATYYTETTWELPHFSLTNKFFILTWVIFGTATSMVYLDKKQYQFLNDNYKGWQQKAFENLRYSISDEENFYTYFKKSNDRKRLIYIAFMNSDGIGSSRILLSNELTRAFPNGYYVALPDRSCGLIIPKGIEEKELKEIKFQVTKMHKTATTAMSGQLHSSNEFTLPDDWAKPIDEGFSIILTNEIDKLTIPG